MDENINLKFGKDKEEIKQRIKEYWQTLVINDVKDIPHLPNPLEDYHYEILYKNGILKKEELKDGKYYLGKCRNANVAKWDEQGKCFWYMRNKFGSTFPEKINHLQDDNRFDLFVPLKEVEPKDNEIVL